MIWRTLRTIFLISFVACLLAVDSFAETDLVSYGEEIYDRGYADGYKDGLEETYKGNFLVVIKENENNFTANFVTEDGNRHGLYGKGTYTYESLLRMIIDSVKKEKEPYTKITISYEIDINAYPSVFYDALPEELIKRCIRNPAEKKRYREWRKLFEDDWWKRMEIFYEETNVLHKDCPHKDNPDVECYGPDMHFYTGPDPE